MHCSNCVMARSPARWRCWRVCVRGGVGGCLGVGVGGGVGVCVRGGVRVPCGDEETDACYALCDTEGCSVVGEVGAMRLVKIGIYFALWFGLSTGYNLQNKVRLNLLPLPWTQSAFSLVAVRFASKKQGGSSSNGRDSNPKFQGIKKYGGEHVRPAERAAGGAPPSADTP